MSYEDTKIHTTLSTPRNQDIYLNCSSFTCLCIHFAHLVRDYTAEPELVQLQRLMSSNIPRFLSVIASPLIFIAVIAYAHLDAV